MTQKRFYSEDQLLKRIDGCFKASERALKEADGLEAEIVVIRSLPHPCQVQIDEKRDQQRKLRKYATNQIEKKAAHLKQKLSEMRTRILPFGPRDSHRLRAEDRSIPQ